MRTKALFLLLAVLTGCTPMHHFADYGGPEVEFSNTKDAQGRPFTAADRYIYFLYLFPIEEPSYGRRLLRAGALGDRRIVNATVTTHLDPLGWFLLTFTPITSRHLEITGEVVER